MTPQKPDQFNEPPTPLGVAVEMERWVLDNGGDAECWDWIGARAIRDLVAERDAARDRALEQAAYEVAELAAHDCAERDWPDGERVCMRIAAGIRMLKGAKP